MTIGKLSGQCDFGQKGQSYCNQRGQSCVAKRVKVAWLFHPWTETEQVEQDLLICRALTEIYKDPYLASHLAFRGGTALHKLFLSPQPRYSEDIDLVQVKAEPIKETYDRIREALSFLGEPKVK